MIVNHQDITADSIVAKFSKPEITLIVQCLELVAAEQARVSFVPVNKNLLPEWVLAEQIKNQVTIALKSNRAPRDY